MLTVPADQRIVPIFIFYYFSQLPVARTDSLNSLAEVPKSYTHTAKKQPTFGLRYPFVHKNNCTNRYGL